MSVNLSPVGGAGAQFFDNNGSPLSGGKLYSYSASTTTPAATYTSIAGTFLHTNPIVLNAGGRVPDTGEIWLADNVSYKFVLKTSADALVATWDNVNGINSNFVNYTVQEEIMVATADQTVFNLSTITYTPATNSLSVFVDGVNQILSNSYVETDSNTVTFVSGLHVGAEVKFTTAIPATGTATDASVVSYTPAGTGAVATTVQAKLRESVSVLDFGAVGDGVTDDTAAVQAAIDSLNVNYGGTIYFPVPSGGGVGSYKCSTLNIPATNQSITLEGDSSGGSVISYSGTTGNLFSCLGGANALSIKNLYLTASAHTAGWCMDFQGGTFGTGTTITGATKASPVVISTSTTPTAGDIVYISNVSGMTQLNNNYFVVGTVVAGVSFELKYPNTGAVNGTSYGTYASGGTWQLVTNEYVTRDLLLENLIVTGFANGIRAGQTINSRICRSRIISTNATPALPDDSIGLQIGDSGFQGTTTIISNVYCLGSNSGNKWGTGLWNKWCSGLVLDNYITDACSLGLRSDSFTTGSYHSETNTQSLGGTAPVNLVALAYNAWAGTSGAAYSNVQGWTSAAQQISKIRTGGQENTKVSLANSVTETADNTFRTLVFDTAIYNSDGDYSVSTGIFTAPVPGMYRVYAQVTMDTMSLSNTEDIRILVGSQIAIVKTVAKAAYTGQTYSIQIGGMYFANKGDEISVEHRGSNANDIFGDSSLDYTFLDISLIN